jgi:regulator of replication initiation timing
MNALEQQIKTTGEKFQRLLKQYQSIQKENQKLRQELAELKGKYSSVTEEADKWRQQSEILKLSKSEMNELEKKDFEKRLSQYVREIDRCIALLNE